nr:MAG TPA: hypothetical protein [Caudoviricetes sp.]
MILPNKKGYYFLQKRCFFIRREPCQSAKIGTAHFIFYPNGKSANSPEPPKFSMKQEKHSF